MGGQYTAADVASDAPTGQFTAADLAQPPATSQQPASVRLGTNLLSGAGVTSTEGAKQFFTHPIDVLKGMAQAQGELGVRAKNELANKDYVRGLTHAVEYLMPGLGPNLAQAGDQLQQGDISGGVGRTLGAAIPIVAGSPEGRAAAGSVASTAASAAKVPLRLVGNAARTVGEAVNPDVVGLISPRSAHGLRVLQKIGQVADTIGAAKSAAKDVATNADDISPELTTPTRTLPGQISPETTRPAAVPAAAPIPQRSGLALPPAPKGAELGALRYTGKSAAQSGEALANKPVAIDLTKSPQAAAVARFSKADIAAAQQLLHDATGDLIDQAVPPTSGENAFTKARVNYFLKNGDVAGAESALDQGAKHSGSGWQPLDRQPVPSTNEIRERIQAEAKIPPAGTSADKLDTHALQQEMNWNLERHGWSAEQEARREFIARNSTGMTKGELARHFAAGSGKGVPAAPAAMPDDLTGVLQKSLDAVRARSQAK